MKKAREKGKSKHPLGLTMLDLVPWWNAEIPHSRPHMNMGDSTERRWIYGLF